MFIGARFPIFALMLLQLLLAMLLPARMSLGTDHEHVAQHWFKQTHHHEHDTPHDERQHNTQDAQQHLLLDELSNSSNIDLFSYFTLPILAVRVPQIAHYQSPPLIYFQESLYRPPRIHS